LSNVPVWIRGFAPRVLRRTHAIIALTLPLCVAASATAEEPLSQPAAAEMPLLLAMADDTPPVELETIPSAQEVSEAPPAEAQGGTASNLEPHVVEPPRIDAPLPEPARHLPPASPANTPASVNGPTLGLRLPTFIAFGLGGLGAGGAVVARLAATTPYTDPKLGCNGRCADGSHTLGMTSTILAGLAVGALGTGVVLALSEPAREKKPLAPVLKMSVSPSKAAASASWAF
jgi:hypothetical protein